MAADLEVGLPLVDSRRLEGTLVAPRTQKRVPNHLTDTSKSMEIAVRFYLHDACVY